MKTKTKQKSSLPWMTTVIVAFFVIIIWMIGGQEVVLQDPVSERATSSACSNFEYSNWSGCATDGTQSRTITKAFPEGCSGGNPVQFQNCKFAQLSQGTTAVPKSYLTGSKQVSQQILADKKQEELPTARINSTSDPTPDMSISKNQEGFLELTSPLYGKYSFLDRATGLSVPLFESIYQKQQSSIASLQNLQSIEYRSDVADVLTVVREESSRLLKVITDVKDLQDYAKRGMVMLVAVNKEYGSMPIEEDFRKFVNGETIKVDDYIYMFNPKNPDSIGNVVYERDMKTTELQEALILSIQNTR